MTILDDLIQEIGGLLLRAAREQSNDWDYVGFAFATTNGADIESSAFLFKGRELQEFSVRSIRKELREAHLRLRQVMRVKNDNPWIASISVLRQKDMAFKQLVEFDRIGRWRTGPADVDRMFDILVGEAFPDALGE